MTTKLGGPLKREIEIAGALYTVTIAPEGMTLVLKGKRKGFALNWNALISGDAAIATALNASLTAPLVPKRSEPKAQVPATRKGSTQRRAEKGRSRRPGGR
ncbi:MAG: hypothetical protein ACM3JC_09350 [Rudaea sp.]